MKILSHKAIKRVENATISDQNITSWQLMERASKCLSKRIIDIFNPQIVYFMVGKGGNGGDGLAMARICKNLGCKVIILTTFEKNKAGEDYQTNFELLPKEIETTDNIDIFQSIITENWGKKAVLVDAIFGVGYICRPHKKEVEQAINLINSLDREHIKVVSVDIPTGMGCDIESCSQLVVNADYTFTIDSPKLTMLLPTWGENCGKIEVIDIDYSILALEAATTNYYYSNKIDGLITPRKKFAHKGSFGSLLIIGSGKGMFGASIIAAKGAESVGVGSITVYTPEKLLSALYSTIPTAMAYIAPESDFVDIGEDFDHFSTICIGMGMGKHPKNYETLKKILLRCKEIGKPIVIDADALNIISENRDLIDFIPKDSILTPHVGEFRRLVGQWSDEGEKLEKLRSFSSQISSVVVLKGAHSAICTPLGDIYFNSTGSPALSRAASGDMLCGMVGAILSRGVSSLTAARIGLFLHGKAGERAAEKYGEDFATIERILGEVRG
ncbi:MAG: NAD(P)H-hydrate dehydratase [Rikenellaceae bacterium]